MCFGGCEPLLDFGEGAGIEDILAAEPAFAGEADAEGEVLELGAGMGIGIDGSEDAFIAGSVPPSPIHVESAGVGVEFDDGAGLGGAIDDFFDIEGVGVALEEESTGEVSEHGDVGVFHGFDEAAGHFVFGKVKDVVDGGDAVVELGEEGVVEIEGAVFEDIDFGASEESEVGEGLVEFSDFLELLGEAFFGEAVCLEGGLGMVGDAEVGEAEIAGGLGHFSEGVFSVGGGGVVVKGAAKVGEVDEIGEVVGLGGGEFAPVFAEFGRNESETESLVDFGFAVDRRDGFFGV